MNWLTQNFTFFGELTLRHLALALPAILVASLTSVSTGWWTDHLEYFSGMFLTALSLLYTVLSLPMFIIIPVIVGIALRSSTNMAIALVLYGIAVLVRQVADALASLPTSVLEATDSLSYPLLRRFFEVELPLALPTILAGVCIVGVSTVSLVMIEAFIDVRSLGTPFTGGFQRGLISEVLSDLVATVTVVFTLDALPVLLGRVATPWTRPQERPEQTRKVRMTPKVSA